MNKQMWGKTPPEHWNPNRPLYIPGRRDAGIAKSRFLLHHPLQAYGEENLSHIAGQTRMSFLDALRPFADKGLLIYTNGTTDAPPLVHKPRVHIIGLGDVGAHCALGLRLLGEDALRLGLYARKQEWAEGFSMELAQCRPENLNAPMPDVQVVRETELTRCDALVFAASAGVPAVLQKGQDVRMMQLEANKKILANYLEKIREEDFKGTLFILSDPVDALCAYAAKELEGTLPRERIIGLGLGVMAARAAFYAPMYAPEFLQRGRAYGPHGEGLWIANSLDNYDDARSAALTHAAKTANLAIRDKGRKPYYGPSISSGAFSILSWIRGEWFYASIALGPVFFGCRVRQQHGYLILERNPIPSALESRLQETMAILKQVEV